MKEFLADSACQVPWCSGRAPKDWQTGMIMPMHK